ncbi:MAG TPA: hypothetical protein VLX91_06290 [Candidatus Acidoferrales bacterium]|nr:hypothetical protein [Candidatus Acidoferrales bacterium]
MPRKENTRNNLGRKVWTPDLVVSRNVDTLAKNAIVVPDKVNVEQGELHLPPWRLLLGNGPENVTASYDFPACFMGFVVASSLNPL